MNRKKYLAPSVKVVSCMVRTYIHAVYATGGDITPGEWDPGKQRDIFEPDNSQEFETNSLWDDLQ